MIESEPIASIVGDLTLNVISLGELISKKQWKAARSACAQSIEQLKRTAKRATEIERRERDEAAPMMAYMCDVRDSNGPIVVPAKTASKARWIVVNSMREIWYMDSIDFRFVQVRRYPKLDQWALTAKQQAYNASDVRIYES